MRQPIRIVVEYFICTVDTCGVDEIFILQSFMKNTWKMNEPQPKQRIVGCWYAVIFTNQKPCLRPSVPLVPRKNVGIPLETQDTVPRNVCFSKPESQTRTRNR